MHVTEGGACAWWRGAVKSPPNPNVSDPREGKRRALGLGWPLWDSSAMLSPRLSVDEWEQFDEERTAVEPLTALYVMLVVVRTLAPRNREELVDSHGRGREKRPCLQTTRCDHVVPIQLNTAPCYAAKQYPLLAGRVHPPAAAETLLPNVA